LFAVLNNGPNQYVGDGVVEESAVTVYQRFDSLVEYMRDSGCVECCCKLCAVRVLNAMHRPQDLVDSIENNAITWLLALMICRDAAVIGAMPILRGNGMTSSPCGTGNAPPGKKSF
jgi:hypothetical protein